MKTGDIAALVQEMTQSNTFYLRIEKIFIGYN
jgi:hypothetical protein